MLSSVELQLIISFITILGAGVSVYVGVRVALAEIKTQQKAHDKDIAELNKRVSRLEDAYFK